jgi:hypothetical protein
MRIQSTPQHCYLKINLNHVLMFTIIVVFQVCLITVVYPVIVFYVSSSIALPHLTSKVGKHRSLQRTVLRPHARPFLGNSQGSVHIWDTKKLPRKLNPDSQMPNNKFDGPVKTTRRNNVKRPSIKSPINFRDKDDTPILFPDSDFPSRNQHEHNTNAWFDGEGMEQRMLLPRGYSIPEEMYGPNYIWDTKGWPRLINTTKEPIYNHLKGSTRNKVSYDSPIIFQDSPFATVFYNHKLSTNQQAKRLSK